MAAIHTVVCYPNLLPFEPTETNVDAFMEGMRNAGVTHVQVNHLPDLMHPEQLAQPDNVYLWFANFGPPLDLFVTSRLNHCLWPEMYLERNRRTLLRFATAARRHGIQPLLYLCEPRFVPERFFQKHPTLRGPRVDNPVCSKTPLFALCTDLPEVRAHYREMMAKIMELVPDLRMVSLFTSDSGSGFDYNPDQYAGPNGAGFNRGIPLVKRVVRFLSLLLEEGRRKNPEFTVNLTSGFSPETRAKILAAAPAGIVGSVYGLYDWEGGLEEHWAYHQAVWGVPKAKWNIRNLDRTAAAADRFADMKARFEAAALGGREPIVHAEIPTYDYTRPLRYVPHPFETIRIMRDLVRLGARKIAAWGVINPKSLVPYDVNAEAMRLINENIAADPMAVVSGIAGRWVDKPQVMELVEAWRRCDQAWTQRPLWTHAGLPKYALPGPLVPDLTALRRDEISWYRTIGLDDLEMIQGVGAWLPMEADERNRDHVLHQMYETETLPTLRDAALRLEREAAATTGRARAALQCQCDHIRFAYLIQRSHYNWYEAGRYLAPGPNPGRSRTMPEIVDDEIRNTRELIALLEGRLERFIRMMPSDSMTYEIGPGFVEHLKARIPVMEAHRKDPPRDLGAGLRKMREYVNSRPAHESRGRRQHHQFLLGQRLCRPAECRDVQRHEFAIRGLTKCWAQDLAPFGIRVNTICPGYIYTAAFVNSCKALGRDIEVENRKASAMHLLGRQGRPEEVAGVVASLPGSRVRVFRPRPGDLRRRLAGLHAGDDLPAVGGDAGGILPVRATAQTLSQQRRGVLSAENGFLKAARERRKPACIHDGFAAPQLAQEILPGSP